MSGRVNKPLAAELVGPITKLRGDAVRAGELELESELTAILNFVVFGARRRGRGIQPVGAP